MLCPTQTEQWVAALFTLDVTWPAVLAAGGGTGKIYIWSLNHYMISGTTITGTSRTCGNQVPPLPLNATGKAAIGAPADAGTVNVMNQTPTKKTWDPDVRTAVTSGAIGGWNVGSSITINPTTSVAGLSMSSTYSNPATAWPMSAMGSIMTTDLSDDDMDGNVGITAYPLDSAGMGFYLPATSLAAGTVGSTPPNKADKLFIVSRTEVTLSGMSTSCTETTGTLTVPKYDLHVVGCHTVGATAPCTDNEWQFIDGNVTLYAGSAGGKSFITGTFDAKQLPADAGTPTCDDVVTAFPTPSMM